MRALEELHIMHIVDIRECEENGYEEKNDDSICNNGIRAVSYTHLIYESGVCGKFCDTDGCICHNTGDYLFYRGILYRKNDSGYKDISSH